MSFFYKQVIYYVFFYLIIFPIQGNNIPLIKSCNLEKSDHLEKHISTLLHHEIKTNPDRHIFAILQTISNKQNGEIAKEVAKLIQTIKYPKDNEQFPRRNKAYRAILSTVRSWAKQDYHSHVSPSLSVQWVIDSVKNNWHQFEKKFKELIEKIEFSEWREKKKYSVTLKTIQAFLQKKTNQEIKKIFSYYNDPEDAFDIPMLFSASNQVDFLLDAISYVSQNYFNDGVRLVGLQFNPCKEYNGVKIDPFMLLEKLDITLKNIETLTNKKYGGNHQVQFICSFNQANHPEKKEWFIKTMEKIIQQKIAGKTFAGVDRIIGIDLSGRETDGTKRSNWKELHSIIEKAKQCNINLKSVCHAGDRWNVDTTYDLDIDKHLKYMKDTILIKNLSEIGHGNLLWPDHKIVRINSKSSLRKLIPDNNKKHKQKTEKILRILKEKNIAINALPKPEFYTIQTMKKHPFYYWKKMGIQLCVGIDGTSYIGSTLSEWITWLLLAAPQQESAQKATLTVAEIQQIVCLPKKTNYK